MMSDINAAPRTTLATPATLETVPFRRLNFPVRAKGSPSSSVIADIDKTVPTPNTMRYPIPTQNDDSDGSSTSITAALPATPCTTPIVYDLTRKKGLPNWKKP